MDSHLNKVAKINTTCDDCFIDRITFTKKFNIRLPKIVKDSICFFKLKLLLPSFCKKKVYSFVEPTQQLQKLPLGAVNFKLKTIVLKGHIPN